eukprot:2258097-Lingulodinium_polyedra.AAC.1
MRGRRGDRDRPHRDVLRSAEAGAAGSPAGYSGPVHSPRPHREQRGGDGAAAGGPVRPRSLRRAPGRASLRRRSREDGPSSYGVPGSARGL